MLAIVPKLIDDRRGIVPLATLLVLSFNGTSLWGDGLLSQDHQTYGRGFLRKVLDKRDLDCGLKSQ